MRKEIRDGLGFVYEVRIGPRDGRVMVVSLGDNHARASCARLRFWHQSARPASAGCYGDDWPVHDFGGPYATLFPEARSLEGWWSFSTTPKEITSKLFDAAYGARPANIDLIQDFLPSVTEADLANPNTFREMIEDRHAELLPRFKEEMRRWGLTAIDKPDDVKQVLPTGNEEAMRRYKIRMDKVRHYYDQFIGCS